MDTTMNNPPAFPNDRQFDDAYAELRGMTLRDYLAAAALTGICSRPHTPIDKLVTIAGTSYELADAMLKERNK